MFGSKLFRLPAQALRSVARPVVQPPCAVRCAAMSQADTKRRMNAVNQIAQITLAMKMVAAAKLKHVQDAMNASRPYASTVHGLFDYDIDRTETTKKVLVVVCSTDKGMCGPINSSVNKEVKKLLNPENPNDARDVEYKILFAGEKATGGLKRQYADKFTDVYGELDRTRGFSPDMMSDMVNGIMAQKADEILILFNHFKNAATFQVTHLKFPGYDNAMRDCEEPHILDYDFDDPDSREEVMENLYEYSLGVNLYLALSENAASEQGSRMNAMDNSTTNAQDIYKTLLIEYNKARQAKITGELAEISSGTEAIMQDD